MLRLSTLLDLSFTHRKDATISQYDYVFNFLNNLAGIEVEKPYANNLFNGIRDLTSDVKNNILNTTTGKTASSEFIVDWLQPSIQPLVLDEYYSKIASVIRSDISISSEETKNKLLKTYNESKYDKFLLKALLFAITRNNIDIKDKIPSSDMEFIFEADKKCAQCGKDLIQTKSKKTVYRYGIVQIYPEGLSASKQTSFNSISNPPTDYNHKTNKICLCCIHADEYESNPTLSVFANLIDKKSHYEKVASANSLLEKAKLDEELRTVLSSLKNIKSFNELAEFRTTPLELKEKIDGNEPLRLSIKNDVDYYYNYLRSQLSDLDDVGSEIKVIASQFKICYQKLSTTMTDQEEIYNRIIRWVLDELRLPDKYQTAGRIIVSFFVQSCEVFDEISK